MTVPKPMTAPQPSIAFIGTGIMGAPIAGHILDAGYDVTVYNRTASKTEDLVACGAHYASTPAEAASGADVVFTMVGYPTDVEEVYLGDNGILAAAAKGAYLVDLTTSSPTLARELHDAAEAEGKHAFDCPVTGGEPGARAATLTLIVGADEDYAAPVVPVLETFSSQIFFFQHAGNGQTAKLCNQISLASCMVGMADAISFAQGCGLDVEQMLTMVGSGMGSSRALTDLGPKVLESDWSPGFLVEHLRKDIGLAMNEGETQELIMPGVETAYALYDTLCEVGGGRLGTQAIQLLYSDMAEGEAAGLDWSTLSDVPEDATEHECCCGHDHHAHDHQCGHDHHAHDHQCCHGHHHNHGQHHREE